jgi:hypothetical protein
MGPLSVRARPSSLKRDCDRRTTSTGETCLVNVYATSRLIPEPNGRYRPEPNRPDTAPKPLDWLFCTH